LKARNARYRSCVKLDFSRFLQNCFKQKCFITKLIKLLKFRNETEVTHRGLRGGKLRNAEAMVRCPKALIDVSLFEFIAFVKTPTTPQFQFLLIFFFFSFLFSIKQIEWANSCFERHS